MNLNSTPTAPVATADQATLKQILLDLLVEFAYQEGDFTLSSGQSSSYYINGKKVTLHPHGALAMARLFLSMLPDNTKAIAGLTLGADPIVSAVSVVSAYENRPLPALIVRKAAKGHGTKAYIEGPDLNENAMVVVLEDVVTTGASAMQAVERLRQAGYKVNQIISLVDRQQGAADFYRTQGLEFQTIFALNEIQQHYRSNQP